MNFSAIKILPGNDDDLHKTCNKFIKTDAFTVLPTLSPQIPGPPPTPNPYRVLPPIVSRKKPSFVILQEVGSRPVSREPSPMGRVSPFRGCGFKPPSREQSPSRLLREEKNCNQSQSHRSRSRLPVTPHQGCIRRMSKSVSPIGQKSSAIPRPLNRRISYSPNRAMKVLSEIHNHQLQNEKLKGSRNVSCHRSVSQCNLKEWTTSRTTTPKPPIPQKLPKIISRNSQSKLSRTPSTNNKMQVERMTKCEQIMKSGNNVTKRARNIPVSPVRAAKYEPRMKSSGDLVKERKCIPTSPMRAKIPSRGASPSKSALAKSKENISPNSKTASPVKMRNLNNKIPKSPICTAKKAKTINNATVKPSCAKMKNDVSVSETPQEEITSSEITPVIESAELVVTQPTEEQTDVGSADKFNSVRTVGKKALTTSNLLSAIKNRNLVDEKVDDKKELSHTDTSRSLPISIRGTGMTDSTVTLIRTTTEPALAPVQPELITEIRSVLNNEVRNVDETQLSKTISPSRDMPLASAITPSQDISSTEEKMDKERLPSSADRKYLPQPQHSPHLKHEAALNEIKTHSSEISNDENPTMKGENNRNGIDKGLGPDKQQTAAATMKNRSEILSVKKQSTECLVEQDKKSMGWERFRSQRSKRGHTTDGHPVQVSTITQGSTMSAGHEYSKKSCCGRYLCYFCYKYKFRKRDNAINKLNSNSKKFSSCFGCKNGCRNLWNKLRCCNRKKRPTTMTGSGNDLNCSSTQKSSCCAPCKSSVYKCLGILCCWNSAVCKKMRKKGDTLRSGCYKCLCCGAKKQTVIAESERRRSTISTTTRKPRKWTRIFTDFPKLDSSFVEHASVMRGAIPVLPLPLAWICLILNVFLPGFGTLSSGVFCLCTGKARFSINDSLASRFGSFLVNLLVAGSQLFTVLFCLVGWGWSIWWGVIMLRMSKKNKRILMAEQVANEPRPISVANQDRDVERGVTTA